jgi:hypothetical protein
MFTNSNITQNRGIGSDKGIRTQEGLLREKLSQSLVRVQAER